jgi:hypothetical protein
MERSFVYVLKFPFYTIACMLTLSLIPGAFISRVRTARCCGAFCFGTTTFNLYGIYTFPIHFDSLVFQSGRVFDKEALS